MVFAAERRGGRAPPVIPEDDLGFPRATLPADDEPDSNGRLPGRVRGASGSVTGTDEAGFVGEHDGLHASRASSFMRIRPTWVFTVGWARKSRSPISVLLSPVAMRMRTSVSR